MTDNNHLILEKLTLITQRLDHIELRIDHIEQSTNNMDNHISFVENIYDTCKMPFFSLMNMVTRLQITSPTDNLPTNQRSIEN